MPPRPAAELEPRLPRSLARLVVDVDGLGAFEVDPAATAGALDDAAATVLAGSAERDLSLAVEGGLVTRG